MSAQSDIPRHLTASPDVGHTLTYVELIDLFTCALGYKVDGVGLEDARIITRAHEALDRQFEAGRRQGQREGFQQGYDAALQAAKDDTDGLLERVRG